MKKRKKLQEVSTDQFSAEDEGRLPTIRPRHPSGRLNHLRAVLGCRGGGIPTHLWRSYLIVSPWKVQNSRGSVTPIYSNMLSTLFGEVSSPLFNRTGLLLHERWQRQTARFPLAWPPAADVLPSESSSPGIWTSGSSPSGRRTAAARRVVSSSRCEEAAAIRLPARAPAHVYRKERSQSSCQAGACHRWVPHLWRWRGP